MEVDSVHACIERRAEGAEIGTPSDWSSVFLSAKLQGEQYTVDEQRHYQFVDWKQVALSAFKPNCHKFFIRNIPILLTFPVFYKCFDLTLMALHGLCGLMCF